MKTTRQVEVRWMIRRDLAEVVKIELDTFPDAWTENDFEHCLKQRNVIGMVAEEPNGQIVGYMIYELNPKRVDLLNFAVHPEYLRQGIGSQMISTLAKGQEKRAVRNAIHLEIGEWNLAGQLFFREAGFIAKKVIRNQWENQDSYLMERQLNDFAVWRRFKNSMIT